MLGIENIFGSNRNFLTLTNGAPARKIATVPGKMYRQPVLTPNFSKSSIWQTTPPSINKIERFFSLKRLLQWFDL